MKKAIKIVIVEDEVLIAHYIKAILQNNNYRNVKMAYTIAEAQKLILNDTPDIMLLDINVEGWYTGIELAAKQNKATKLIYITAQNNPKAVAKAGATQPAAYLTKPLKKNDLLVTLNRLL